MNPEIDRLRQEIESDEMDLETLENNYEEAKMVYLGNKRELEMKKSKLEDLESEEDET